MGKPGINWVPAHTDWVITLQMGFCWLAGTFLPLMCCYIKNVKPEGLHAVVKRGKCKDIFLNYALPQSLPLVDLKQLRTLLFFAGSVSARLGVLTEIPNCQPWLLMA